MPNTTVNTVDAPTAHTWLQAGEAILIDVREDEEYATEHIAVAHLAPLSRFFTSLPDLAGETRHIVMHCRSGKRSAEACKALQTMLPEHGHIYNLEGGILKWRECGLPVTGPTPPPVSS